MPPRKEHAGRDLDARRHLVDENNAFRNLLESTPVLKTLKIDHGTTTQDTCLALTTERNESEDAVPLPSLKNIHITRCVFHAGPKVEEAFKSMARSHRLQRVVLGGTVRNVNPDGTSISKGLETFGLVVARDPCANDPSR
ncbi:hypothetical protein RHS01_10285 [Rhizoctonia solani]|uniref:Uncharacterized protein n=1 Tax=Rhizoctonia solani TaxID=456999 RepID=A0A8H7I2K8_9AGAM|nr:hypothetical protein RHS01_10285 [Rhizoctonia solani]